MFRVPNVYREQRLEVSGRPNDWEQPGCLSTYDEGSNGPSNIPPTHEQRIRNTAMRGVRDLVDEQGHRTRESGGCATDEESRHDETNIIVDTAKTHSQYE